MVDPHFTKEETEDSNLLDNQDCGLCPHPDGMDRNCTPLTLKLHRCSPWAWPAADHQGRAKAWGCLYPGAERLSHLREHSHFQLLWPANTGNLICLLSDS